jgi:hypothetical protein
MNRYLVSGAAAIAFAGTIATTHAFVDRLATSHIRFVPSMAVQQGAVVELIGCLYRERDIPGRPPNAPGYTLTNAHPPEGLVRSDESRLKSSPAGGAPAVPLDKAVLGSGGNKMYLIEKIAEDRLTALLAKRVEVTGRIGAEPDMRKGTSGRFEAVVIREVPIPCPPTPPAPITEG